MNKIIIIGAIVTLFAGIVYLRYFNPIPASTPTSRLRTTQNSLTRLKNDTIKTVTIAENLDTPWAIAFLPDNSALVTERKGTIRLIDSKGHLNPDPVASINEVKEIGEGGLLGIVLHPDFESNGQVYLYYTYGGSGNNTLNRVVRMTYKNKKFTGENIIVDGIPGASNHNGGRIKFGPDNFLYVGTGDAQNPSQAQDTQSLAGKILRVTGDGKIPSDNPFNNQVFSYGHRNVQGFAWNSNGEMWATEHGRSGILSGLDELNLIEKGKNYGWPEIQGDETKSGMVTPKKNSGSSVTWAPAGGAFIGNSLYFGGLRGQTLYEAVIENSKVIEFKEHFQEEFGRIREVIAGPDGMLYITTSNRDGRGNPASSDDKVIRIDPTKL